MILNNYSRDISGAMSYVKLQRQFNNSENEDFINYCIELRIAAFNRNNIWGDYTIKNDFATTLDERNYR